MAVIKEKFATSSSITITLNSLTNGSARESTAVDNTTNLYLDVFLGGSFKLAAGTPASDKCINVYVYGSEDGSSYGDNATGTDAALTMRSPTNLRLVGVVTTPDAGGLTYQLQTTGVAKAFDHMLPRKWGVVVENRTGLAFDSTGCAISCTGVNLETV